MNDLIEAVRFEVMDGKIQLFDKDDNKVDREKAFWAGNFHCSYNKLTSLEGSPKNVGGNFHCSYNKLTSLEGSPENIGGDFDCYDNELTTLEGSPKNIGGGFYCHNNKLTSLEGSPENIGGDFFCYSNKLTSLEGKPKSYATKEVYESFLEDGFLFADRILQKIISKKVKNGIEIFHVENLAGTKKSFTVKQNDNFSHGETLKDALEDLAYKISDRDTTEYKDWNLGTTVNKTSMVVAYRKITGACFFGVKDFLSKHELPEVVSVKQIIEITKGSYGHGKFKQFFEGA